MSLYIGDSSSGKVMHITTDSRSVSDLQSGILPDTVYHSNMEFITYTEYAIDTVHNDLNYLDEYGRGILGSACMASTALPLIRAGRTFLLVDNAYNAVSVCNIGESITYNSYYNGNNSYGTMPVLLTTTEYLGLNYSNRGYLSIMRTHTNMSTVDLIPLKRRSVNATKILIFNIDVNGDIFPMQRTSSDIKIANGKIDVLGVNLASLRYVATQPFGGSTRMRLHNGSNIASDFYLVNRAGSSSGSLEIQSSSATGTVIKLDGQEIISSNVLHQKLHFGSVVLNVSITSSASGLPVSSGVNHHRTIGTIDPTAIGKPCIMFMKGATGRVNSPTFIIPQYDTFLNGYALFQNGDHTYIYQGIYLHSNGNLTQSTNSGSGSISYTIGVLPIAVKILLLGTY